MRYLIFFFLLSTSLSAQDYRDSLTKLLKNVLVPKMELKRLEQQPLNSLQQAVVKNKLGVIYQKEEKLDSAYRLHLTALKLALQYHTKNEEVAVSYNKIGIVNYYRGQYDSAAYFFHQAIPYYINPLHKANTLNNLALMYKYQERPDLAIEAYLTALSIYKKEKEVIKQVPLLNNIGALHFGLKEDSLAEIYSQRALALALEIGNKEEAINSKSNLASIYFYRKDYSASMALNEEAIEYFSAKENIEMLILNKNNLANGYDALKSYEEALNLYQESLELMHESGYSKNKEALLLNIGTAYYQLEQPKVAVAYYLQALEFAQTNQIVFRYEPIYKQLAIVYEKLHKMDSSLFFKNKQLDLRDSLHRIEKQKKLLELESAYQNKALTDNLNQTQAALENTTKEKSWFSISFFLALGFIFLGIIGLIIIYNRYKTKRELSENLTHVLDSKEKEIELLNIQQTNQKLPYPKLLDSLTEREREVLLGVQEGLKDKEIATKLFISITTVRTHLRKAYAKTGIRNRAEAAAFVNKYAL